MNSKKIIVLGLALFLALNFASAQSNDYESIEISEADQAIKIDGSMYVPDTSYALDISTEFEQPETDFVDEKIQVTIQAEERDAIGGQAITELPIEEEIEVEPGVYEIEVEVVPEVGDLGREKPEIKSTVKGIGEDAGDRYELLFEPSEAEYLDEVEFRYAEIEDTFEIEEGSSRAVTLGDELEIELIEVGENAVHAEVSDREYLEWEESVTKFQEGFFFRLEETVTTDSVGNNFAKITQLDRVDAETDIKVNGETVRTEDGFGGAHLVGADEEISLEFLESLDSSAVESLIDGNEVNISYNMVDRDQEANLQIKYEPGISRYSLEIPEDEVEWDEEFEIKVFDEDAGEQARVEADIYASLNNHSVAAMNILEIGDKLTPQTMFPEASTLGENTLELKIVPLTDSEEYHEVISEEVEVVEEVSQPPEVTELELAEGWNMVSAPGHLDLAQIAEECNLEEFEGELFWQFSGEWTHSQHISGLESSYVKAGEPCSVSAQYNETEPENSLEEGWNMVSVQDEVGISETENDCQFRPFEDEEVWNFRGGEWNTFNTTENLNPDRGYFVNADSECTIEPAEDDEPPQPGEATGMFHSNQGDLLE